MEPCDWVEWTLPLRSRVRRWAWAWAWAWSETGGEGEIEAVLCPLPLPLRETGMPVLAVGEGRPWEVVGGVKRVR